ncbi:MAG TPA: hypothetical protein VKD90_06350 [Gemmataceae bacterium]|nr:hypothetical protein [Gemmataceae bacterium]
MPVDPRKRELRKLKRTLKRAGSKHRRRDLKRQLAEDPEGAADAEEDFGRYTSENFNGLDQDATRQRPDDE